MENGKTESETIFEEMRGLLQKLVQGEIAGVHARVLLTEFLGIVVSMGIEPAYAIIEENIGTFISSIKEIKGVPGPDQLIAARFLLIAAERGNDKALDFAEESLKEKSLPEAVKFLAANILAHAARKGNNRATIILIGESGHPNVGPEIQQMAEKSIIIAAIRTGDAAAIEFVWTGLKNTPNHRILYSLIESLFYLTKEDPARGAKEIAVFEDVLFDSLKSDMPTDEKLTHLHKLAIAQIFADAIQHDTGELLKKLENRVAWLEKEILSESPGKLQIFLVDILVKLAGSGSEKALSCIKGMLSKMFDNDDKAYQSACLKVIGGLLRLKDGEIFQHLINDQDLPQKVRDLLKDLKELNIRWPERFYYSDLEKIIRNRKNIAESGLKTVVLYPVDDSNFAFTSQNDALSQLCDQRAKTGEEYAVVYYECSTDIELIDALKNCTQKGKTPAYQIIIGGHGAGGSHLELDRPDTTEIGRTPDELEHFYLDLGDKDQLLNEGISNCLSDNGRVVFVTCYGAQGRGGQVNLPNAFRDIFPQAKHILAPDVSTNLAGFTFDEEGGISSVSWKNLDSMANNSLWFFFGERKIGYDAKNPTGSYDMSKGGILSRPIIGSIRDHIPQFRTVPNNRRTF
ncbi:MAG: hypothetical protein WC490_03190 [Candidatus Margulisiibacteriota bacterium]